MTIALVLVLVVAGSVLFHILSPWWSTPIASNWSYIDPSTTPFVSTFGSLASLLLPSSCSWRQGGFPSAAVVNRCPHQETLSFTCCNQFLVDSGIVPRRK